MSEQPTIAKAQLIELDLKKGTPKSGGKTVSVQFNPESLKVSFANQIVPPQNAGDKNGTSSMQFVGSGTTKLSLSTWFDVTALADGENTKNDVRALTQEVAYFITPAKNSDNPPKFIPPAVRFAWGTFQFDGLMDSMEESLDYFSADGRPLRASVSFTLSKQEIQFQRGTNATGGKRPPPAPNAPGSSGSGPAGTISLSAAPAGVSLQAMADAAGQGDHWQDIAVANGITNPRVVTAGQLIDLSPPSFS
jgi:hypothetical protein